MSQRIFLFFSYFSSVLSVKISVFHIFSSVRGDKKQTQFAQTLALIGDKAMQKIAHGLCKIFPAPENILKSSPFLGDVIVEPMARNLQSSINTMENESIVNPRKSSSPESENRKNTDFEAVFLPLDNDVLFEELLEKGRRLVEDGKCVLLVPFNQRESGNPMM